MTDGAEDQVQPQLYAQGFLCAKFSETFRINRNSPVSSTASLEDSTAGSTTALIEDVKVLQQLRKADKRRKSTSVFGLPRNVLQYYGKRKSKAAQTYWFSDGEENDDRTITSSKQGSVHTCTDLPEAKISKEEKGQPQVLYDDAESLHRELCGDFINDMSPADKNNVLRWASGDFTWFAEGVELMEVLVVAWTFSCDRCCRKGGSEDPCQQSIILKLKNNRTYRKVRRVEHTVAKTP